MSKVALNMLKSYIVRSHSIIRFLNNHFFLVFFWREVIDYVMKPMLTVASSLSIATDSPLVGLAGTGLEMPLPNVGNGVNYLASREYLIEK